MRKTTQLFLALLLALAILPGTAAADPTIVEIENQGDTLVFYPVVEFNELILTVTGPCDYQYRQVVESGGTPYFRLDETTIDGMYRFNIMRNEKVDASIVKILAAARKEGNTETSKALCREGKLPAAPISQASGFTVSRGKIIFDEGANEKDYGYGYADDPRPTVGDLKISQQPVNAVNGATMPGFALKDFVINDDLIVDGSACIGFDCVNGESFSFDTIRLKENNLRIKFDDTSVAASFPRTDWQLTANASANGGASKFSIDDISGSRTPFTVEANARSHSLYVDDGGRIGNRTSTPSTEIHTIDGDTPTLRLQQDGSSGFAPQTWDVAGNETNFFIRDVSNGSTLPFRIRPSAPTSSIFIDVDGDVGFGTASPDSQLHILNSDGDTQLKIEETSATTNNARVLVDLENNGAVRMRMTNTDNGDSWVFIGPQSNQNLVFNNTGNAGDEFVLEETGDLTIAGTLTITGGCTGCDAVLTQEWPLDSIEENAAKMWENKYLPAVGPTPEGEVQIDVFQKTTGMLQELEKAHVYIEQLHNLIQEMRADNEKRDKRLAELESQLEQ